MFDLAGRNAYITGGSSGIGRAVAELFIAQGARVVIADIVDAAAVAGEMGAVAVHCNVAEEDSVRDSLQAASAALGGPLDIVVLNAGVGDVGPNLTDIDQPLIEKVTRINHWGVI